MPSFTLSPATPADYTRLGEIQYDSFKEAADPFYAVVHNNTSKEDYVAWVVSGLQNLSSTPGRRTEIITARDESGKIAGWIRWSTPSEMSAVIDDGGRADPEKPEVKIPKGMNAEIWAELIMACQEYETKYMDDKKYWALILLVIDPLFQRRGVGKLLVQDGINRAHTNGYPLFVAASPPGALLYKSLGFELKEAPEITRARVVQRMMVKDVSSS